MSPRPPALWGLSARVTVAKIVIISISCIKKWRFFFMNANFYKYFEMYKFSNFYYGLVKQIKFKSKMENATRIIQRVLQL